MKTNRNHRTARYDVTIWIAFAMTFLAFSSASAQPVIALQPRDRFLNPGQTTNLSVNTAATSPSFQWFSNQAELAGETNRVLSLTNGTPSETGDYFVVVRDATGSVTSRVARVKVFVPSAHGFSSLISLSNHTATALLAGEVNSSLAPYYDLYPVEVSSNLVNWTPLATFRRTNATLTSLSFLESDAGQFGSRFYRIPTNHFATYLPTPTGPFPVGVTSRLLTDPSRTNRRPFMISLWYPAVAKAGVLPSLFMDARVASRWLNAVGKADTTATVEMFQSFHSHALLSAPLAGETAYPTIVYSPGQDNPRAWSLAQFENLASHGYIVVSIDHNDATASVYPDGKIVSGVDTSANGGYPSMVQSRVQDVRFVFDELARWAQSDPFFQGRLDLEHLGIFGFSLGGETVMNVGANEPRCKAVLCVDGSATSPLPTTPFDRPFLYAYLALSNFRGSYVILFNRFTHDAYRFDIKGAAHGDGDDSQLVWDTAQSPYVLPTEAHFRAGRILRAYALSFFNKYLKGEDDHVLDGPLPEYPEIINYTKK